MKPEQFAGIALLVLGLILIYFGFQATESVGEQIHESITGRYSETTMWYLIGGTLSSILGIGILSIPPFVTTD